MAGGAGNVGYNSSAVAGTLLANTRARRRQHERAAQSAACRSHIRPKTTVTPRSALRRRRRCTPQSRRKAPRGRERSHGLNRRRAAHRPKPIAGRPWRLRSRGMARSDRKADVAHAANPLREEGMAGSIANGEPARPIPASSCRSRSPSLSHSALRPQSGILICSFTSDGRPSTARSNAAIESSKANVSEISGLRSTRPEANSAMARSYWWA